MSGHIKWSTLRDELRSIPGAEESIAQARELSLEEVRLYEPSSC